MKLLLGIPLILLVLYLLLMLPSPSPSYEKPVQNTSFVWDQDEYWSSLGKAFDKARAEERASLSAQIDVELEQIQALVERIDSGPLKVDSELFADLERSMFKLGPKVAASPEKMHNYVELATLLRSTVKRQSIAWDINSTQAKSRIYRLLYGVRTAVEEVMLQQPVETLPALEHGTNIPSKTPSVNILGAKVHSGDLLISRGGAATSALISRGNDYQGNFSHVAVAHVDEKTGKASIIEAHIEKGMAIASVDEYINDTKLRMMVLRLRDNLPAVQKDPLIAHKAATAALNRANGGHVPYDFSMDFSDTSQMFCSEVASAAYHKVGIDLWMDLSRLSGPGIVSWLGAFGVRHFDTQAPSDLEYDPQLVVVAEWRDPKTLRKDHTDNAVIDAMLEKADEGAELQYNSFLLPFARMAKAYSFVRVLMGGIGPVPEGMNASCALRNEWFTAKHESIKAATEELAKQFEKDHGYPPPYWELLILARKAVESVGI